MLKHNALHVADRLTTMMADRGYAVAPTNGGVIDNLVDAARPILSLDFYATPVSDVGTVAQVMPVNVLAQTSLEKDPNGEYRHGRVLEETLFVVANAIRADHDFARNGVNPIIRGIVEAVEKAEQDRVGEGNLRPDVAPYFYADLWENSSFVSMVGRYGDTPVTKAYVANPIPMPEGSELMELVKTGVASIDTDVEALLESRGEEYVARVYRAVFENDSVQTADLELRGNSFEDGWFFSNSRISIDAVIIAHLIAKALSKREAPENYTKSKYDEAISSVMGASGQRLYRAIKQREQDAKNQQLVLAYGYNLVDSPLGGRPRFVSPYGGVIVVNGDVYNEYLEKGGSPEALMGAAGLNQPRDLGEILARNEELLAAYKRREAIVQEQLSAGRFARVVEMVRTEVFRFLNSLDESEMVRSRDEYAKVIREELATFRTNDIESLWYFVRRLICRVFFPHTNALRCLTKIDDVATRMPDADVKIATFHATIEMLVDWTFEQVEVNKLAAQ